MSFSDVDDVIIVETNESHSKAKHGVPSDISLEDLMVDS